jgi:hypothetical protein
MSVIKNIVNIQDNRLDYVINGTNSLRYIFRGTEHFRLTEVGGTNVCKFIAQKALDDQLFSDQTPNADFIGRVSTINNHSIQNLNNVTFTDLSIGDTLVYNGTSFVNGQGGVGSITLQDATGTSTLSFGTNFRILGTDYEIDTQVSNNQVRISLPSNMATPGSLTVNGLLTANGNITTGTNRLISAGNLSITNNASIGNNLTVGSDVTINGNLTVNGTQTIIYSETKLIEDPLIELGYTTSPLGNEVNDIGFFGQYRADNYAGLYYDVSSTSFRIFDALGTSVYEDNLVDNNMPLIPHAANIIAKNFQTSWGSFGTSLVNTSRTFNTNDYDANIVTVPLENTLSGYYGVMSNGIFSGKLIAYSYTDVLGTSSSFSNSSVTLLNYVLFIYSGLIKASFTVEIEDKTPNYAYINFSYNSNGSSVIIDTNEAATSLMTEGMPFTTVLKILPIVSAS